MGGNEYKLINKPFVDENFNEFEENKTLIKDFLNEISDERIVHNVLIEVKDLDMAPTAIFFSLKKRINVRFTVKIWDFEGANFIHSFLKNSHIEEVVRHE